MNREDFTVPDYVPEPPAAEPESNVGLATALEYDPAGRAIDLQGLPANLSAERTILGAILLDNAAYKQSVTSINTEDFMLTAHQTVFRMMGAMIEDGRAVDIVTLSNELSRRKQIEQVGGVAWLASLTEGLPRRLAIAEYLQIVAETSVARQAIGLCSGAVTEACSRDHRGPEVVSRLIQKLAELAASSKIAWRAHRQREFLVGARTFMSRGDRNIEWIVQGLIQRGHGLFLGDPGTSKSLIALHMLLHVIAGRAWLGHSVPKPMRCALVSREDHPGLTRQRILRLVAGLDAEVADVIDEIDLEEWLYLNTRAQTETFSLEKEGDVAELIEAFREKQIGFAVFDVFRRLWEGDENDNREANAVLATLNRIEVECGCTLMLLHHLKKNDGGSIFERSRGASSIHGWREFAFGVSIANPEEEDPQQIIRKLVFETKADTPASPIHYKIDSYAAKVGISPCEPPAPMYQKRSKKAAEGADKKTDAKANAAAGGLF